MIIYGANGRIINIEITIRIDGSLNCLNRERVTNLHHIGRKGVRKGDSR